MEFYSASHDAAPISNAVANYDLVLVIVSPPRCSSTAFARTFWQHPRIRYYAHEPFETTYYRDHDLSEVAVQLQSPLDLDVINTGVSDRRGAGLVIKEMPYQVGAHFPLLASWATGPVIFLLRDPRINIASRMAKKAEVGDSPNFPHVETGWELLAQQVAYCREHRQPYMLVDAADFRNHPRSVFPQLFERYGLAFSPQMLRWEPLHGVKIDNLDGEHTHLYRHVLTSRGIEPDDQAVPALESFPVAHGWRDHVAHCLTIYERLRGDERRIRPNPPSHTPS